MSKAKNTIEVTEPPKIPTLNFGKRPSMFSGGKGQFGKGTGFVPPKIRITQSKGAGSGK